MSAPESRDTRLDAGGHILRSHVLWPSMNRASKQDPIAVRMSITMGDSDVCAPNANQAAEQPPPLSTPADVRLNPTSCSAATDARIPPVVVCEHDVFYVVLAGNHPGVYSDRYVNCSGLTSDTRTHLLSWAETQRSLHLARRALAACIQDTEDALCIY